MSHPPFTPDPAVGLARRFALVAAILGSIAIAVVGVLVTLGATPVPDRNGALAPSMPIVTQSIAPGVPTDEPNAVVAPPGERLVAAAADPSRVRISRLGIDLAVLPGADPERPRCQVAEFLPEFGRPADPANRSWTFIYAHGRPGMFGPLVDASPAVLRSSSVEIWTGDGRRITYAVEQVITNATDVRVLSGLEPTVIILQTCETADGRGPKRYLILRERSMVMDSDGASPVLLDSSC
jgi:hypothetical protein